MPALDDCVQSEEILAFLREYAKKPLGFLIFAGKNGTGKTFAAQAVMKDFKRPEWREHKYFISQTDLNLKWQKEQSQWGTTIHLIDQLVEAELFTLDDLGTRTPTEAFMDFLYTIIDKRYTDKDCKGTIITTNLTAKDIRERFGDAFMSRIGSGKAFRFEGKDRRCQEW